MVDTDRSATDVPAATTLARVAGNSLGQAGSENFPVALRILPRAPRERLTCMYAYARFVDDVGDEAPGDRLVLLDLVESDVRRLPDSDATLAPVAGLAPLVRDGLPLQPLLDLVAANRQDQTVTSYETFDDLLDYCRLSAAPVGQVVLFVAGVGGEREKALSDAVCGALQVLEHCQDVAEDAARGRVYLPAEELRAAGLGPADLTRGPTPPALRAVLARQVDRADEMLTAGTPLLRHLRGWSRLAVAGYLAGGRATVSALRAADHDVLAQDVVPTRSRTLLAAVRLVTVR